MTARKRKDTAPPITDQSPEVIIMPPMPLCSLGSRKAIADDAPDYFRPLRSDVFFGTIRRSTCAVKADVAGRRSLPP
jgi:hypothetical protein